ncbi:hypothetical protein [Legionella worsleiensis]|uniref:Uncharacterized protein n=1 Tax=Legionella worsleiensis TaxID=45076 RepID=A0A0W1AIL5_9GAMM|nr:hypothetical protein [Legionella worsleiensis]KTD81215.1 hypothetical protein Lwor_0893 [Legionella worsleiensis]STY33192.1 Uncharacterised protein [Legionella worsleiensis]
MISVRIWMILFCLIMVMSSSVIAADVASEEIDEILKPVEPLVGSWTFSGMVTNESGDRYGYFFQIQREGTDFHTKTALIDGQTNKLVLFYEGSEKIEHSTQLNWQVGRSFIRYNPINDSWIFGVKSAEGKGFNFKVDMLKQAKETNETLTLRPGVDLQALQTSRLNGHIQTGSETKEQFVTGNKAWFGKVWFSKDQTTPHDVSTTFCRLDDDNGFYSANLKEEDATGAAVAGWRDAAGNKVRMSQFISIKSLESNQCLLSLGFPKMSLKLLNTLSSQEKPLDDTTAASKSHLSVAGFSENNPKGFCFITEQSFAQVKDAAVAALATTA